MKRIRRGMTAMLFAVVAAAPAFAQSGYHIGALLPNSGPMTQFGQLFGNGANLAADHINGDKLLSKPFTINHEDSQGQPQAAVTAMNKLVRVNQEPMVLTAMSGISKAIAPIGEREKVVAINGGGVAPDLAKLGPYFFNTIPLVNFEVRALLPYLAKEKSVKRIAIVYVEDPLGEACLTELKENAPKNGMELVGAFSVPSTSRQFAPIAAKVREVNPDAVYVAYFGQTMVQLVKQLRDGGVDKTFVSYSAFNDPDMMALPAAEGSIYSSQKMDWTSSDPVTSPLSPTSRRNTARIRRSSTPTTTMPYGSRRRRWRAWRRKASRSQARASATNCSRSRRSMRSAARWNSSPMAPSFCRCRSTN